MNILGIHGGVTIGQHDAAAALVQDGKLICCVEEERLSRIKSSTGMLPIRSIHACLKEAGLRIEDIDLLVLPGETYEDIHQRTTEWVVHHFGYCPKIEVINHQLAHIASSFYQSSYDSALCISYDAYGDGISGAVAVADRKTGIQIKETFPADNSLGVFYATMTSFLGFKPGEDEYKIMGLAPYGVPTVDLSFFCKPTRDGYEVDHRYFRSRKSASQYEPFYSPGLVEKLGSPRHSYLPITDWYKSVAASTQYALEKSAVSLIEKNVNEFGYRNVCLSGGVALNCSLNKVISQINGIDRLFVQPSSSDRGLALGCALYAASQNEKELEPITHVFYGPTSSSAEIENALRISGVRFKKLDSVIKRAAQYLHEGKIIAWFQGRSEYGPRALGHRSILANPTLPHMKDEINKRVKFREEFRPFAPSVVEESYQDYFKLKEPSPYMTIACDVVPGTERLVPATTHVNSTARVQTVELSTDPLYHNLIHEFSNLSGVPVVLNTSFNIRGQPIVETALEAISTFAGNGIDALFLGNYLIEK